MLYMVHGQLYQLDVAYGIQVDEKIIPAKKCGEYQV